MTRFPSLADLDLAPSLRARILERGGKVGPLEWIAEQDKTIPTLKHEPKSGITFREAKLLARKAKKPILVRSNNSCEYLPGTEGMFETICVYDYDGPSDDIMFRQLSNLPNIPAPHLQADWPKHEGDLQYATVPMVTARNNLGLCNLVEHPNLESVFWMTLNYGYERTTILSDDPTYIDPPPNFSGSPKQIKKIFDIARRVSQLEGLHPRYSKQMEFALNERYVYLTQVKILTQKEKAPKQDTKPVFGRKRPTNPHDTYRTFGMFDVEVMICERTVTSEPTGILLRNPSDVKTGGRYHCSTTPVAIFRDGRGAFMHEDIPYFLYGGVALGNGHALPLTEDHKLASLPLNKRARLKK